jgi:hypothetical protein
MSFFSYRTIREVSSCNPLNLIIGALAGAVNVPSWRSWHDSAVSLTKAIEQRRSHVT